MVDAFNAPVAKHYNYIDVRIMIVVHLSSVSQSIQLYSRYPWDKLVVAQASEKKQDMGMREMNAVVWKRMGCICEMMFESRTKY